MKVVVQPSLLDPTAARTISVEDNAIPIAKTGDAKDGEGSGKNKNSPANNKPSSGAQRKNSSAAKKK
jgi:hypothetical protein